MKTGKDWEKILATHKSNKKLLFTIPIKNSYKQIIKQKMSKVKTGNTHCGIFKLQKLIEKETRGGSGGWGCTGCRESKSTILQF